MNARPLLLFGFVLVIAFVAVWSVTHWLFGV